MSDVRRLNRILVANRGEIAIRIFRALNELGKETVAIYSEQDNLGLHRYKADEAYVVGRGKQPVEAYLDIEGILEIAQRRRVDAIHPGYGFLAENPRFARACEEAGIAFIGPKPAHLDAFGDKVAARNLAKRAGLPLVPATEDPVERLEDALRFAKVHGYPIMVKAVAGGGGRGMRIVRNHHELEAGLERARSEALKAFGDPAVYLEKYVEQPKHIEVQVLGDLHGNYVHLFERDCSVQRRHQKVVEIAPSLVLTEAKREEMCAAAINLMRQAGYVNAATVEFLYDRNGNFYFLEVNPRIQVEHTITELITGIDIVHAQVRIAEGYRLHDPAIAIPDQASVRRNGYAIQCRVTTEDPENGFLPDHGRIVAYRSAAGFGVRLDTGNGGHTGAVVTPHYDSLLVKISTFAPTFDGAARKMQRSLSEFRIRGVKTNIPFLENVVQHPRFLDGSADTTFIDRQPELLRFPAKRDRGTRVLRYIGYTTVNRPKSHPAVNRLALAAAPVPEVSVRSPFPDGTKTLLTQMGPDAFSRWILDQERLLVTDTTFRDAHQSLLATRVRTYDMLAVAEATAKLLPNLFSLEMWGGATFDVAMRFNKEDPWDRLAKLRASIPNICFQMLLRASNAVGYANYPDNVVQTFVKEAAEAGIDIFRIFDSLNWVDGMQVAIDAALDSGSLVEATLCYTGDILDPSRTKYTLSYYVDLAQRLERMGAHILGIKDMAGLLKPYAAERLVRALKESVGIPIHFHTHDTAGNGVAAAIKAAEAGVDIVDMALPSMSGLSSQPSMGAIAAALQRTPLDTGIDLAKMQQLDRYWESVRGYYGAFEAGLKAGTAEVYVHEMPGGQYSNLRMQADALGLSERWNDVVQAYVAANRLMGDVVKVTPSSKAVGDLALFMVQNDLTEESVVSKGRSLTFPDSVIDFFSGLMGQPAGGFPKPMQEVVLKGKEAITVRPGELLEAVDWDETAKTLEQRVGRPVSRRECVTYALYPKVFLDFIDHQRQYSDVSVIDTPTFFYGLEPGDETEVEIEEGKRLIVKLTAIGELLDDGTRAVHFELNGQPREVRVRDESAAVKVQAREKADPDDPTHVGASMPGVILKMFVESGDRVEKGESLLVAEAMKMETSVQAPQSGVVERLAVKEGDRVDGGDLLLVIAPEA